MRNGILCDAAGKTLFVCLCLSLVLTAPFPAHAQEESTAAKKLLLESARALGGEELGRGWSTRVESGVYTANWPGWGELHAKCDQFVKKPDKMKIDRDFGAYDHPFFFIFYYNAGDVWAMINLGVRQNERYTTWLTDQMRTIDGLFYYVSECDTFYLVAPVPDDSLLAGSSVERVGIVDNGDTLLVDIDRTTRLPVRQITDRGATHILFSDYRDTRGLKVPFHLKVYQGGALQSETKWESVRFDETIDDAIFEEYRPEPPTEESSG